MNKLRVGLLVGGPSAEHEVSLSSGEVVKNALKSANKYEVAKVVITMAEIGIMGLGKYVLKGRLTRISTKIRKYRYHNEQAKGWTACGWTLC